MAALASDPTFRAWALPGKHPARTKRLIEQLARLYGGHPLMRWIVVRHILQPAGVPARDHERAARAIHAWVRDEIRFELEAGEQVLTPARVIRWLFGDCDDRAGLVAACLESLRIPWRLQMELWADGGHIWPEAHVGGRWTPLETSDRRARFGEHPRALIRRLGARPF